LSTVSIAGNLCVIMNRTWRLFLFQWIFVWLCLTFFDCFHCNRSLSAETINFPSFHFIVTTFSVAFDHPKAEKWGDVWEN
jgi:hypothetical protein